MSDIENKPHIDKSNPYLLRKLEEASGYYGTSYSSRYGNWRRHRSIARVFSRELGRLKGGLSPVRVLDLGCGDGHFIYKLKSQFDLKFSLYFMGVDLSFLDIDFATKRKEYFGHTGCDFKQMDVQELSSQSEPFDIVICSEVIEHMPRPEYLAEVILRVLKPGGLCILTTPHKGGGFLVRLLRLILRLFNGFFRSDRRSIKKKIVHQKEESGQRLSSASGKTGAGEEHVSVLPRAVWAVLFRAAGFRVQACRGTSGMVFGDPFIDEHPVLFALSMIADAGLVSLPFSCFWFETLLFELRKPAD